MYIICDAKPHRVVVFCDDVVDDDVYDYDSDDGITHATGLSPLR